MGNRLFKSVKLAVIPFSENNWRPKILSGRFFIYYLIFLFFLKMITVPFLAYFSENVFFADITRNAIVGLLNKERLGAGLYPLKENPILEKAAYLKAKDMLEKDYFSHQSPEGVSPWHWFQSVGYKYNIAGENLAIGFLDSEEVYRAWMESPSHKANILNQSFRETGVAVLKGDFNGNTTTIVVNLFGKPLNQSVSRSLPPTAPQDAISKQQNAAGVQTDLPADLPGAKATVLSGEDGLKAATEGNIEFKADKTENKPAFFGFLSFAVINYYGVIQKIIYISLIFLIILLLINIFVRIDIQHPDLILKTLGFAAVLIVFAAINKITLINLIPHSFIIS